MTSYATLALKYYFTSYSGLTKSAWRGIILHLINSTLGGTFYFLSIYFVSTLGFSVVSSGMIIACYGIGAILGGLIGGTLSDKFSPEFILRISLLTQAICDFALIKLNTINLLMADSIIIGIASYAFITANYLYVLNKTNANEGLKLKAINLLSMGANLGLGLSSMVIGSIAKYGFQYIFFTTGSFFFLSFIYLTLKQKNKSDQTLINDDKNQKQNTKQTTLDNNKNLLRLIFICVFFVGLTITQLCSTYPIYLQEIFPKTGIKATSIIFTLNSLLIVLFEAPLVSLFCDYNKITMVGIGALLIGLGMLILKYSYIFPIAIVSCVIYTIGEMIFFSIAQLVCYQNSSHQTKGYNMGIFRVTYALTRVIGPAAGGIIYSHLGGSIIWFLCGIIGIVCMSACIYNKNLTKASTLSSTLL